MRAAVVANGEVDPRDRAVVAGAELVVAADGGARRCAEWGIVPHLTVGDLDSATGATAGAIERHPRDKDETDLELALVAALERGATDIVLIGALGGPRRDHDATNLLLLAHPRHARIRLSAVCGGTRVRALHGGDELALEGQVADIVTLVPVAGDAEGIETEGLRYALRGGSLTFGSARGVSNVIDRVPARVRLTTGTLLVFEVGVDQRTSPAHR